jgi:protein-disulfide isomerase
VPRVPPLLLAALGLLAGCVTQPAAPPMTAAQADAILAELRDIKRLLGDRAPAAEAEPAKVRLADVAPNVIGAATAPVTLIEFTDYQCPFCRRFHERSWPELKRRYVDTGRVRLVVRDLPLEFHGQALPAAIAARCAGEQGHFAPVFEALLAAPDLSPGALREILDGAGVAREAFERCAQRPELRLAIAADGDEAQRLGINGTPGFVIAQRSGAQLEGVLVVGAQPTSVFTSRIDALLAAPRGH